VKIAIQGSGLAGTILALTLSEKSNDADVHLVNRGNNVSSRVAAGILNPVTGKRMTLTYMAESYFPKAFTFYAHWEEKLGAKFLHELTMCRPFLDETQRNDWMGRRGQPGYDLFIESIEDGLDENLYTNPLGVLKTRYSGWLDTNTFLDAAQKFLRTKNILVESEPLAPDLTVRAIGYAENAYWTDFKKNPVTPMKGEILTLESPDLQEDILLSGGCFICPIGHHRFKVGATYDGKNIDLNKTEEGKSYLLKRFRERSSCRFELLEHEVGIRPASWDRRPILGYYDENTYVLNGLGSKGVSMAPLLAEYAVEHIFQNSPPPSEIHIRRIFDKLS
jgi:glycine oxidase